MKYVIINRGDRKRRVRTTPIKFTQPAILFLGGLLHIQDKTTKRSFPSLMQRLHGRDDVTVIMPIDSSGLNTWQNKLHMFAYSQGKAGASVFAKDIYDFFFAHHIERFCKDPEKEYEQTTHELSNLSLVGYSYGSLLIQQISGLMADHLRACLPTAFNTFEEIAKICASVKAINIGPICNPLTLKDSGAVRLLKTQELTETGNVLTLFSQLFFMMRDDKIVQRSVGREPIIGRFESNDGIEVIKYGNHLKFYDYVGKPVHKLIGIIVSPGHQLFPKITANYDYILHDLRTYTNEFEVDGTIAIYPSLPIAPILRECYRRMVAPNTSGQAWIDETKKRHTSKNALHKHIKTYLELNTEFFHAVRTYEKNTFDNGIIFLEGHVEACKKRLLGGPVGQSPASE